MVGDAAPDVFDDDPLSVEDALAVEELMLKAELEHRNRGNAIDATTSLEHDVQADLQPTLPRDLPEAQALAASLEPKGFVSREQRLEELLVDLEDVGLCKDRVAARRKRGLNVTDFSSAEWCQQQVAFSLSARLPKEISETAAMRSGTEQHAKLEAETAGETIVVAVETREDKFAIRLVNMMAALHQLLQAGLTREFSVCGFLQGVWVWGIIDQLEMGDDESGSTSVRVVEQKTRFQPNMPGYCQKRTTALQTMIYSQLFQQLPHTFHAKGCLEWLPSQNLDPHAHLSEAVSQHVRATENQASSLSQAPATAATLLDVIAQLSNTLGFVPPCSPAMFVNYIWQGDGVLIEQDKVQFDAEFLNAAVARHLQFWRGEQPPEKVATGEEWKCSRCNFRSKCKPLPTPEPGTFRKVRWQH